MQIRANLEPFQYNPEPTGYNDVRRVKKKTVTLDNGAEYEGEWDETNHKDGKGV